MGSEHPESAWKNKNPVFLRRICIRNYKSIEHCCIEFQPLSILVGRNGSGKSNFLDSLRFVTDALRNSLDHAIKSRGGLDEVRRRSQGHPHNFAITMDIVLSDWRQARFSFEIASQGGRFVVKEESLRIRKPNGDEESAYHVEKGIVISASQEKMPPAVPDRFYLVNAAGLPAFRPVYDVLSSMGFYNLNPRVMKDLQSPDAGDLLAPDGRNIASVMARLGNERPQVKARIAEYLKTIVPDITDVERIALGPKETLEFRQKVEGAIHPWRFYAASMSDGTLRALGTMLAVMQLAEGANPAPLVGIEEPETALHPAAAGALMDALREATAHTQILVTTHSPDLLDQIDPAKDSLLVVESREGNTRIALADPASLGAIKNHLYTPGELLRMDQLEPDRVDLQRQRELPFPELNEGHA